MPFQPNIYRARRRALREQIHSGVVLLAGSNDSPMNYAANPYPFVQDSCFLYFFGLNEPGLAGVIDLEGGDDWLFGRESTLDDVIWHGDRPTLGERAALVGVAHSRPIEEIGSFMSGARRSRRTIHYTPPYRADTRLHLAHWLNKAPETVAFGASLPLIRAIVLQRECKAPEEIEEMERALAVTSRMHLAAMAESRPGVMEHEVVGVMEGIVRRADLRAAYPMIFSRHGEVLHNIHHRGLLQAGDWVINDSGATSPLGYASDITRTLPVGGRFSSLQRDLYDLVLAAQSAAIDSLRPGATYLDVHKLAARTLVEGLVGLELLCGDPHELVEDGVHAILFQSGLGHQIGLDVHDMEALGEEHVGYGEEARRSPQFGLNHLRMARTLKSGMTLTVEPGLYFIPALIERWAAEDRFCGAIRYDRLKALSRAGGVRIEDDLLITDAGASILGPPIPRAASDVEAAMQA